MKIFMQMAVKLREAMQRSKPEVVAVDQAKRTRQN
jgi:hypothetical protein